MKITEVNTYRMAATPSGGTNWVPIQGRRTPGGPDGVRALHPRHGPVQDRTHLDERVLTRPIPIRDGYATVPEGVGWGTDIDLETLKAFPPNDYAPVESGPYIEF